MANTLNKIVSEGIKDGEVKTADIADQAVDLTKLPHGDGTSDGKFLRSNNGADPTWVAVTSTPEGTAIKSTGETGGTKFLREDGDNTCSWQTVSAGTALTGSTNNTITTVTGANAIQGEDELTFDGHTLTQTIDSSAEGFNQTAAGDHVIRNIASSNRSGAAEVLFFQRASWNGNQVAELQFLTGSDTTNKDEGAIALCTHPGAGGSCDARLYITHDGHVTTNKTKEMFWYKSPSNTSSQSATSNDEILVFQSAVPGQSNSGVYDSSNGRYTAPIAGVYYFFFNGLIDNNAASGSKLANLYKNGSNINTIAYTHYDSGTDYKGIAGSATVNLAANDYVQIWCKAGMHTAGETNFGGYLIG